MHMSDALVSPPVALGAAIISATLIGVASHKLKDNDRPDIVPFMGVMGAFVFAAQMINFAIPGTGSSGHLIGGILLSAILGPWAGFITLCSILIVQCLVFADGGLLALGCNILNMAVTACLIAYPLIYKPLIGKSSKPGKIVIASILASVFAIELGAFGVTVETVISGVTALPFTTFVSFMLPIHLAIGCIEGLVTAALIIFICRHRPTILISDYSEEKEAKKKNRTLLWVFSIVTIILASGFSFLASQFPDGLEWSIDKISADSELLEIAGPSTAIIPDYESGLSGIIGAFIVMIILWGISSFIFSIYRKTIKNK